MDAMEAILTRRSIRKYTKQPVPDEVLKELLEAAMCAPSAGNQQPWCFVVINDRKILNEVTKYHPYAQMLKEAPVAIFVCCDWDSQLEGYGVQDCSAATQNRGGLAWYIPRRTKGYAYQKITEPSGTHYTYFPNLYWLSSGTKAAARPL